MPGFLVEFRAQAAQVLGRGRGGVGGAGDAFAGAFFVVESVRSIVNRCAAEKEVGRTLPLAMLLLPALDVSGEVSGGASALRLWDSYSF